MDEDNDISQPMGWRRRRLRSRYSNAIALNGSPNAEIKRRKAAASNTALTLGISSVLRSILARHPTIRSKHSY